MARLIPDYWQDEDAIFDPVTVHGFRSRFPRLGKQ
jgi:hypothetical protein